MIRLLLALMLLVGPAMAATSPVEMLRDPVLEARARELGRGLRCLVCQNQSIDDSDADLAKDLRRLVRERLTAGDSDGEVMGFLVARYGDFILLQPPVRPATYLLWFGPLALLLAGAGLILAFYRSSRTAPVTGELSPEERLALNRLLDDGPAGGR